MTSDLANKTHKRITWRYAVGLLMFAAIIAGEQFVAHQIVSSGKHDAYVLNIAGKQRMHSQRIASLAQQIIVGDEEIASLEVSTPEELAESLVKSINEMRAIHKALTEGDLKIGLEPPSDPRLIDVYFRQSGGVDAQLKYFTLLASEVAETYAEPVVAANAAALLVMLRDSLMVALDGAVLAYVEISAEKLAKLRNIQSAHIIGIIILITLEILFIFRPMADRVRAAMRDLVSEKQKVIVSLEREREISSFAENSPDPIIRLNKQGQVLYSNPAATKIVRAIRSGNIRIHELLGKPLRQFMSETSPASFPINVGATNYISVAVPSDDADFANIYFRDITDLKRAEDKALKSQRMEAIGQLTGGVAHDFNNLLMVITGSLQLAASNIKRDEPKYDKAIDLIESALDAVGRSAGMTRNLLAFSRRQSLDAEKLDVSDSISSFLPLLKNATGGAAKLVFNDLLEDHKLALLDRGQLEAALLNLTINARDAMPHGGNVCIETRPFHVSPLKALQYEDMAPGEYIMISVTDEGHGIPEDIRDRIAEPFFTTKEVGAGSGLGLSMVWGFVKQSGGHMTIYSEEDIGTTIRLFFPVADAEENGADVQRSVAGLVPKDGMRVLVVEDNAAILESIQVLLVSMNYDVLVASSGEQALQTLKDTPDISLVLTDIAMPGGMNGVQLAEEIQAISSKLPVVLISGFPNDSVPLIRGQRVLTKPFTREELSREMYFVLQGEAA